MTTTIPNGLAQHAWRDAVATAAAKAREKLPALIDSIDLAEQLTLAGDVLLSGDGSATVGSQTTAGVTYTVQGQRCSCPRGTYAPAVLCKHTLAVLITRRAMEDATARVEQATRGDHDAANPASSPDAAPLGIDSRWIVPIQGKPHALYSGLLSLAHQRGLVKLEATLLSVTAELATAQATATFADGRTFTECGDASPSNVGSRIKPHYVRMALTRAKARALRDALNLADLLSVEELAEE
jgi:hypothetical protein